MSHIKDLLNHNEPVVADRCGQPLRRPTHLDLSISLALKEELVSCSTPHKRMKTVKDQLDYKQGPTRGTVRYPVHEYENETLQAYHDKFNVYPKHDIASYPAHIPYNSGKKHFRDKTGRNGFDVFHYQFTAPGKDKVHSIVWDYTNGLVRITPLFKYFDTPKTEPGKVVSQNSGLKDICHSITGGALAAQGWWFPYEVAKAIAATSCWDIRHALTPVFGKDIISMCIHPNSNGFRKWYINPEIIRLCKEQANEYRKLEMDSPAPRANELLQNLRAPRTPSLLVPAIHHQVHSSVDGISSGDDTSEISDVEAYTLSPSAVAFTNPFSPKGTPRSTPRQTDDMLSPTSHNNLLPKKRDAKMAFGQDFNAAKTTLETAPAYPTHAYSNIDATGSLSSMVIDSPATSTVTDDDEEDEQEWLNSMEAATILVAYSRDSRRFDAKKSTPVKN